VVLEIKQALNHYLTVSHVKMSRVRMANPKEKPFIRVSSFIKDNSEFMNTHFTLLQDLILLLQLKVCP